MNDAFVHIYEDQAREPVPPYVLDETTVPISLHDLFPGALRNPTPQLDRAGMERLDAALKATPGIRRYRGKPLKAEEPSFFAVPDGERKGQRRPYKRRGRRPIQPHDPRQQRRDGNASQRGAEHDDALHRIG